METLTTLSENGEFKGPICAAVSVITTLLNNHEPEIRESAVKAILIFSANGLLHPLKARPLLDHSRRCTSEDTDIVPTLVYETVAAVVTRVINNVSHIRDKAIDALPQFLSNGRMCSGNLIGLSHATSTAVLKKTTSDAIFIVVKFLENSRPDARVSAVQALAGLSKKCASGDPIVDAIPVIINLLNDDHLTVRESITKTLPIFSENASTAGLKKAIYREIPTITSLLQNNKPDIRSSAVEALASLSKNGAFGDPITNAIPAVITLLNDDVPVVRKSVIEILPIFSENAGLKKAIYREIPTITPLLQSNKPDIRSSAVEALASLSKNGAFGDPITDVIPAVITLLNDDDPVVRKSILETLPIFSENAVLKKVIYSEVPTITQFLKSGKLDVQASAVEALASLSKDDAFNVPISDAIPAIITLLNDDHLTVHKSIPKMLPIFFENASTAGLKKAICHEIPVITKLLKSGKPNVQASAVEVFTSLSKDDDFGDLVSDTIPVIIALLDNDEVVVRESISKTLPIFSINAVSKKVICSKIPTIIQLLKSSNTGVQVSAMEALTNLSPYDEFVDELCHAISPIFGLKNNANHVVKESANQALSAFSGRPVFAYKIFNPSLPDYFILESSDKEKFRVRTYVIWHSGMIRDMLTALPGTLAFQNEDMMPSSSGEAEDKHETKMQTMPINRVTGESVGQIYQRWGQKE
ncbi:hypothetical protein VKT23_015258 [Stygiomarasmius scandens]|uniref:Uncharacterized protein n=1 Tax=Marasmiellus scandens TaxID=2682957 RepID=A0ABR1J316_9AGAR